MRHPQDSIWSEDNSVLDSAAMADPSSNPPATLACWKLPKKPRRSLGRPFDDERRRAAPFAARREALQQTTDHEQQRREHADRIVVRDEADADRADRHHEDGEQQRRLAPLRIADPADDDASERPGDETDTEGRKGREKRADLVATREEILGDDRRDIAVDREIIPFQDVANHGGADGFPGSHRTALRARKHRRGAIRMTS
jgi:hypothetical protein